MGAVDSLRARRQLELVAPGPLVVVMLSAVPKPGVGSVLWVELGPEVQAQPELLAAHQIGYRPAVAE